MPEPVSTAVARPPSASKAFFVQLAVLGPGLLVMLADADVGNVAVAAQAGARWGFRLLPLLLALIPLLFIVQELTVRLGIFTRQGLGELIRDRFGRFWSLVAGIGLVIAVMASLVTEFTGVAGIGELYGLSRDLTLPMAGGILLLIAASGTYRRIEFITLWIGLFVLAFFVVAASARPGAARVVHEMVDIPFGNGEFWFMVAATIGTCFNPWMMFYQQSAVVDKGLAVHNYRLSRIETATGAILTQLITASVLFAVATSFGAGGVQGSLETIGQISHAMIPLLGVSLGPLVFSIGVLGASMVAAIVCSLALAWGIGELCGISRSLEEQPRRLRWFYLAYVVGVVAAATLVWAEPNLLWLNIVAQVTNVFSLPLVIGFLIILAVTCVPAPFRLRGWYLWMTIGLSAVVCLGGVFGAMQ